MDKWLKPFGFLLALVLICSALVRVFSAGQTLSEYADSNPEIAYASPEPSPDPVAESVSPAEMKTATDAESETEVDDEAEIQTDAEAETQEDVEADTDGIVKDFYYEPLSQELITRITGISYPVSQEAAPALSFQAVNIVSEEEELAVSYEDLRYLSVLYYDFNGEIQTGELICNKGIAQDLLEIFYELFLNEYQIEKIRLIDEYDGDDTASMLDNNTSCFNYRVVDGTDSLSKHALGCAIDINPFYNPYVVFGKGEKGQNYISPAGSEQYADRSWDFPYKIDEDDLCCRLFKTHGFTWGGNWNSCKDYQHFQKVVD